MEIKHFKTYDQYLQYYSQFESSKYTLSGNETDLSRNLIYPISDTQTLVINTDYKQIMFMCIKSVRIGLKVNNKYDTIPVVHRLDGPALITYTGSNLWIFNDKVAGDEFFIWAKNHNIDLENYMDISESDKLLIKMVWSDYGQYH